jgi:hypothetical protein
VSFDDSKTRTQVFDRIPPEDKLLLWFPKQHFIQNRIQLQQEQGQEQFMREKTRELVLEKLLKLQQLQTSTTSAVPSTDTIVPPLPERMIKYNQQADIIMNRTPAEILEFLQCTVFNWINDCNDGWQELPIDIQEAALALGYNQQSWDDTTYTLPLPDVFEYPWSRLTTTQQQAAQTLGYNQVTWDAALDINTHDEDEHPNKSSDHQHNDNPPTDPIEEAMYDWDTAEDNSSPSEDDSSPSEEEPEDSTMAMTVEPEYHWEETITTTVATTPTTTPTTVDDDAGNDGMDEEEFIANFLSEGTTSMPTTTTRPSHVFPVDDDIDEDEFIANFLSESTTVPSTTRISNYLSDRYIPSDDEMDLSVESDDDDDKEPQNRVETTIQTLLVVDTDGDDDDEMEHRNSVEQTVPAFLQIDSISTSPAVTTVHYTSPGIEEELETHESSPLLAHRQFDAATTATIPMGGGSLPGETTSGRPFRRMLGSNPSAIRTTIAASAAPASRAKLPYRMTKDDDESDENDDKKPPPTLAPKKSLLPVLVVVSLAFCATTFIWWIMTVPRT